MAHKEKVRETVPSLFVVCAGFPFFRQKRRKRGRILCFEAFLRKTGNCYEPSALKDPVWRLLLAKAADVYYNNHIMKVAFHTLGCKVNQYESEAMARMFRERGWEVVGEEEFADVYVVNTCTVTAIADRKSRQYIRRMKKVNPDSIVAATGCYSQISPEEVGKIKGVDIVTGTNEKHTLIDYVEEALAKRQAETDGAGETGAEVNGQASRQKSGKGNKQAAAPMTVVRPYEELGEFEDLGLVTSTESRTRAYIKVQEGCNRFCAYCVIPYARGPVRSRPLEDIVAEAKALIDAGYKELVLTGINTAMYDMEGRDLYAADGTADGAGTATDSDAPFGIEKAVAAINELPGDFRIRLSSLEPSVVNDAYVMRLFQYDKLCHHLHMSLQSGSDKILKAMNRPYITAQYMDIVDTLCGFDPCYGISTDIIVGFPGEKEQDFQNSMQMVMLCGFCKTHVFRYSRRPGTKADEMEEQVAPQIKEKRANELQKMANRSAASFFKTNITASQSGRPERVLFEEVVTAREDGEGINKGDQLLTGYTGNYIRVYVPVDGTAEDGTATAGGVKAGDFAKIRLEAIYCDGIAASVVQ